MIMSFFGNKPPVFDWAKEEPDHHYEVGLSPREREILLDLLENDKRPTISARNYITAKIRNAKRHDGPPLPDAALDWAGLEREARRQGCSVADILYDRARGKDAA